MGENEAKPVLLITRYDLVWAEGEESLAIADIEELLGLPIVGIILESKSILIPAQIWANQWLITSTLGAGDQAAGGVFRHGLGENKELRCVTPEPVSFFKRIFG